LDRHYTYFLILAATFAGPFALSFDHKVAFYKKWRFLFPAMILPVIFYVGWDILFTWKGVWSFNAKYVTGVKLANLPIEEILFFLLVPYCCVFLYACLRVYFPGVTQKKGGDVFLKLLAFVLLLLGLVFHSRSYTASTFIFCSIFIGLIYAFSNFFKGFDASSFLVSYAVVLLPFMVVNGLLTAIPVVEYDNSENMALRIYSIPIEDVIYGMLLFLMVISMYERRLSPKA
jgi:lycopene cyclase domain-containing protein